MSGPNSEDRLYSAFFGRATPPKSQISSLWTLTEGLSANTDLQELVLREYAERHEKHGFSELTELKSYLSKLYKDLRERAENLWQKAKDVNKNKDYNIYGPIGNIDNGENLSTDEEERIKEICDQAASIESKAEVVLYRLKVLELYIWNNSVQGITANRIKSKNSQKIEGEDENYQPNELLAKRKAMVCLAEDLFDLTTISGKSELCEKIVDEGISTLAGDDSEADSIRRYLSTNANSFTSEMTKMKNVIDEWREEKNVETIYSSLKAKRHK